MFRLTILLGLVASAMASGMKFKDLKFESACVENVKYKLSEFVNSEVTYNFTGDNKCTIDKDSTIDGKATWNKLPMVFKSKIGDLLEKYPKAAQYLKDCTSIQSLPIKPGKITGLNCKGDLSILKAFIGPGKSIPGGGKLMSKSGKELGSASCTVYHEK